jgi:hypothetical protein
MAALMVTSVRRFHMYCWGRKIGSGVGMTTFRLPITGMDY